MHLLLFITSERYRERGAATLPFPFRTATLPIPPCCRQQPRPNAAARELLGFSKR
ncbi:hypothetical protein [Methanimicrococcus stummii]|uniref:hypothetical protein n=1 Tax=Methanimicrococcus stummii TaxID=3028294 RepID=UPI0029306ABE|nr:hypothetical protein [Methanimicrococcus sp. Es2]